MAHTAYKFFYKETAQNVKNHNPGVKFGDVSRIVGEMWGTLTDAEKEKYRKMAAEDKIRSVDGILIGASNGNVKDVSFIATASRPCVISPIRRLNDPDTSFVIDRPLTQFTLRH